MGDDETTTYVPALIGASFSDVLTGTGFAAAGVAGVLGTALVDGWLSRCRERARKILIEEISSGNRPIVDAAELDAFVAITLRYDRAATEGSAHWKLRLMARVLDGQIAARSLVADEFCSFAELIASLREEEVIFAATVHRLEAGFENAKELNERLAEELVPRSLRNGRSNARDLHRCSKDRTNHTKHGHMGRSSPNTARLP